MAELLDAFCHGALRQPLALQQGVHFAADARHFGQPQLVDLLRRVVGAGHLFQHQRVVLGAFRQSANACRLLQGLRADGLQGRGHALIGRQHAVFHLRDGRRAQFRLQRRGQVLHSLHAVHERSDQRVGVYGACCSVGNHGD